MSFDDRYEVLLADTDTARDLHYRLRYRVYCEEKAFEDPNQFPDGRERDHHDSHARHFVVREKDSGEFIAACRLVVNEPHRLPLGEICHFDQSLAFLPGELGGELSRVCVVREHRLSDRGDRRRDPEILMGLIRATGWYCRAHDIPHFFFLVTKPLARIVDRACFNVNRIGDAVEHRGLRIPYLASTRHGLDGFFHPQNPFAAMFRNTEGYRKWSEVEAPLPIALAG